MIKKYKQFNEGISQYLKGPTKEEIWDGLNLDGLTPDEILDKTMRVGFLDGVKYAIEQGASVNFSNDIILVKAADIGNYDVIEYLISLGLRKRIDDALKYACNGADIDIAKLLLDNGADINCYDDYCLKISIEYKYYEMTKFLLENGANPHSSSDWCIRKINSGSPGYTKFKNLINDFLSTNEGINQYLKGPTKEELKKYYSKLDILLWIQKTIDMDDYFKPSIEEIKEKFKRINPNNALNTSITIKNKDLIKYTIELGANVFSDLKLLKSVVDILKLSNDGIKKLINDELKKCDNIVDITSDKDVRNFIINILDLTPLEVFKNYNNITPQEIFSKSVVRKYIDGINYAVEMGADVNELDEQGYNFIYILIGDNGNTEVIKTLIDLGIDIHNKNEYPLIGAINSYNYELVKYLIDNGADVNAQNGKPLTLTCEKSDFKTMYLLLYNGANPHLVSDLIINKLNINYKENTIKMLNSFKQFNEGISQYLKGPTKEEIWKGMGFGTVFETPKDYLSYIVNNLEKKDFAYKFSWVNKDKDEDMFQYFIESRNLFVKDTIFNLLEDIFNIDYVDILNLIKWEVVPKLNLPEIPENIQSNRLL